MKVPEGWTMKSPEELEEEAMMGDVYEVWSGQEDRDALIREMNMTKETVYELPARFGKKRLTESQLSVDKFRKKYSKPDNEVVSLSEGDLKNLINRVISKTKK